MAVEQNKRTHSRTSVSNTDSLACLCPSSVCNMMESRLGVLGACLPHVLLLHIMKSHFLSNSHKCLEDFHFPLRGQDFPSLCDLRSSCSWYFKESEERAARPVTHLLYNPTIPKTVLTFYFGFVNKTIGIKQTVIDTKS